MAPFLDSVETNFGTRDLYEALGVSKNAESKELRKAYHRLSLLVHPDRVAPEDVEKSTQKFQVLGKIYAILSDSNKRAIYDEDGTVDDEDDAVFKQDRDWLEYWRLLFPKVTTEDIVEFEKEYRGSQEELDDLKSAYVDLEGDMDRIFETMMCARIDDEPRFRELIEGWIADGSVPAFDAFTKETEAKRKSRKRKFEAEAKEAEKESAGPDESLMAMIKARQKSREEEMGSFFDSLEEKYCTKKSKPASKNSSSKKKGTSSTKANGKKKK